MTFGLSRISWKNIYATKGYLCECLFEFYFLICISRFTLTCLFSVVCSLVFYKDHIPHRIFKSSNCKNVKKIYQDYFYTYWVNNSVQNFLYAGALHNFNTHSLTPNYILLFSFDYFRLTIDFHFKPTFPLF